MPEINYDVLAQQYGLSYQLIRSVPEIKRLFDKAIKESWEAPRFSAALENSTWWRSNSETQRQVLIRSIMDPATYNQQLRDQKYRINSMLNEMGLTNMMDTWFLDDMAYKAVHEGWSDQQIKFNAGEFLTGNPYWNLGGQAAEFSQNMRNLAWKNGIKLSDDWYSRYYSNILRGTTTQEQAERDIRNQAAAKFYGFSDQILAGNNVMDLASPYIQTMGQILEVNAQDIDLFDNKIIDALNYKDDKGSSGAKPLWKFEAELRKDPRWLQTNNAREGLMGVAHKVGQDMGVMY